MKIKSTKAISSKLGLLFAAILIFASAQAANAQWTTGTNIHSTNSGNVGIGTDGPTTKLTITDGATPYAPAATDLLQLKRNASNGNSDGGTSMLFGNNSNGFRIKYGGTSDRLGFLDGGDIERLSILNGGNVGIGTTSPSTILHIESSNPVITIKDGTNSGFSQLGRLKFIDSANTERLGMGLIGDGSGDAEFKLSNDKKIRFYTNAVERMTIDGGKVGIGTTNPGVRLHVSDGAATRTQITLSDNTSASLMLRAGNSLPGTVASDTNLQFRTGANYLNADSGGTTVMTLDTVGNVGIGTTTPGQKLDILGGNINVSSSGGVGGNITITGTINAKYQDVAEWVPSSEQLAAGTVVVLDSTQSNHVTSSSVSYDTRVAGVISAQPGIALGEKSDSKVLVATTGRVKVKVDASKGPIRIGDLLVTSDVPGVAMKSEPVEFAGRKMHMSGTLIGKALEPLTTGKGEILVLLSLQ